MTHRVCQHDHIQTHFILRTKQEMQKCNKKDSEEKEKDNKKGAKAIMSFKDDNKDEYCIGDCAAARTHNYYFTSHIYIAL